jgi:hypothetical protein
MNPRAQSHEALKAMTDAASPAGSQAVADEWAAMASGFDEAAGLFQQAMASSEAGWTGEAAEGMRAQLARVAQWSKETGAHYGAASAAITSQSGVSDSAKSSMPPPVPYDPAQMIKDARGSGNVFDMAALPFLMYAQKQKHDAAHEEAARIVSERDRAFTQAAGAIPRFVPPPTLTDQGTAAVVEVRRKAEDKPPAMMPPPRPRADDRGPAARPPAGGPPPGSGPAPSQAGTDPAGFTPGAAGASGSGTSPAGFTPTGGGPAVFAPAGGFGPASAAFPGSIPGAARPPVVGPAPAGIGPGGPAVGVRGAAGKQKRPEYLIEPELEGMFGSDALTAPPVIGEG